MSANQDGSSTSRQPLPERWVSLIFKELQGNYGSRFLNQWKTGQQSKDKPGSDLGVLNAMATWGRKLAGFADHQDAIFAVLEALPEDPPTLPAFIGLCRAAAIRLNGSVPKIEHCMTPEEKAKADEIAKNVTEKIVIKDVRDHRAWAKKRAAGGMAPSALADMWAEQVMAEAA